MSMQIFIIVSKDYGRIFHRLDFVHGSRGRRNHKDPAPLIDVSYRIFNPVEFLIRAASRYISDHAPIPDLIGRKRLLPHAPLDKQLFVGKARLPDAYDRYHYASATLTVCTLNAPNVDVVLNVLIGFGEPPRRTVIATCSPGPMY